MGTFKNPPFGNFTASFSTHRSNMKSQWKRDSILNYWIKIPDAKMYGL